jgi:hypothetical protein
MSSSRRHRFLRTFVPREDLPAAMRAMRDPAYSKCMRIMGRLQVLMGLLLFGRAAVVGY